MQAERAYRCSDNTNGHEMETVFEAFVTLCLAVLVTGLLSVLAYTGYIWRQRQKFDHIPRPRVRSFYKGHLADLTDNYKRGSSFVQSLFDWSMETGLTYVVFILHTTLVFTVDPETVQALLVTENFPKAEASYKSARYLYGARMMGNGLVTDIDHDRWSPRRHVMNPAFSRAMLNPMMGDFNTIANDFLFKLAEVADGKTMVRLLGVLNLVTLDALGKVAYGIDINALQDESNPLPSAIYRVFEGFRETIRDPLAKFKIFSNRAFKQSVRESCALLRSVGIQQIEQRKAAMARGEYTPDDILAHLLMLYDLSAGNQEAQESVIDDFVTFFVAGQETTANTLAFALMELGRHPDMMDKLHREVDEVLGERSEVYFSDLPQLQYCDMILKETLRCYPPLAVTVRTVNREGFFIGGLSVPKNTDVVTSTFVASRHPQLQKDPELFMPERFGDDTTKPSPYMYFPFSLGARNCIGQNFAKMEAKVILSKFVQRFNLELDPEQSFGIEETSTLRPKDGTRAKLTLRS